MSTIEEGQMQFSDLPPEPAQPQPKPVLEKTDCQYCEDVGPCVFCDRGRTEIAEMKKLVSKK
ncbi:MAG: hypothetical protein WCW56_02170 [Candidatus Paceibacterota bacterium]|jgi:hypothetical protein